MEFIDHTGHIFSIKSYEDNPIGYEYEINPYVFWFETEYNNRLSIDNYYIMCIRMLLPKLSKNVNITIEDSNTYSLFSTKDMHNLVNNMLKLTDYISINENEFVKELDENKLIAININDEYDIVPFYVVAYSKNIETIITNILIKYENDENVYYTPISVGGVYYDECEELIINGKNMGIDLPKDILKSIYQYSYKSEVPDETLYANKIKEYLLNFMKIKGEIGNFNSVLNSLKWFGYGEKLEIQKLLELDNKFQEQFFLDDFTINTNLMYSYSAFRSSTYISLRLWENNELDDINIQKYSATKFWGEGKPKLEDLFSKTIIKHYDEGDIDFYRSYYDYAFDELGLKLAMFDYYFKKYFLPIHLHIHSTSISHRVWANDIKMLNMPSIHIHENNVMCGNSKVMFDNQKTYYYYNQEFYTDTNFNNLSYIKNNIEFSYYKKIGKNLNDDILYINQPCVNIPIHILTNGYHDCHLLLFKNDSLVFESNFQIYQNDKIKYSSFVILPKYINYEINNHKKIYWTTSNFKIAFLCNGIWYYHKFNIKAPELQLNVGRLVYKYGASLDDVERIDLRDDENSKYRHAYGFEYDRNKWGENTFNIDIRYKLTEQHSLHTQLNKLSDGEIDFNSFMYVPSLVEVNDINFYDKLDNIITNINGENGVTINSGESNSSQTGMLTRNTILEKFRRKIYLKDFSNNGYKFDDRLLQNGYEIIPNFYFNDYTKDNDGNIIEDYYKIKNFSVDIYFGFFNDKNSTVPFAKKTIDLITNGEYIEELLNNNPYGLVKDIKLKFNEWNEYFAGDNGEYEILQEVYKKEIREYKDIYGDDVDIFDIEFPFKINQCILQFKQTNFVLRFVWNINLYSENKEISSYDKFGFPKDGYFKDITLYLSKPDACSMENCLVMKYKQLNGEPLKCKFKNNYDYTDVEQDYNETIHEYFDKDETVEESTKLFDKLLNDLIKKSTISPIINMNKDFLNRIHIYNLYHLGYSGEIDYYTKKDKYEEFNTTEYSEKYYGNQNSLFNQIPSDIVELKYDKEKYGDYNESEDTFKIKYENIYKKNLYDLYSLFFDNEANQLVKYPSSNNFDYDFYLMHDDTNWYVVFISQLPVSLANSDDLVAPKIIEYVDIYGHKFLMKHYRSDNKFLINRMYFESSNGKNIFSKNNLIVATVDNVNLPFVLEHGSKWEIVPKSLGINKENCTSLSNTNTCIFSIGHKNQNYVKGYYDINVRYSLDGDVQHQQMNNSRICILD